MAHPPDRDQQIASRPLSLCVRTLEGGDSGYYIAASHPDHTQLAAYIDRLQERLKMPEGLSITEEGTCSEYDIDQRVHCHDLIIDRDDPEAKITQKQAQKEFSAICAAVRQAHPLAVADMFLEPARSSRRAAGTGR